MATPMLAGLLKVAASDPKLKGMISHVGEDLHITGLDQSRPWALGTLAHHAPVLVVTATSREAEDLSAELTAMLGEKVAMFLAWETLPHERLSPGVDIIGRRAQVLHNLDNVQVIVMVMGAGFVLSGELTTGGFVGFLLLVGVFYRPLEKIAAVI